MEKTRSEELEDMVDKYKLPLVLNTDNKRVILDFDGMLVVEFPIGSEDLANITCQLLNQFLRMNERIKLP